MTLKKIEEADVSFYVHKKRNVSRKDAVFYNPSAKLSRDVALLISESARPTKIVDLNSGSGAMSIRIAKNINTNIDAYDLNPNAIKLSLKNTKLNKLQHKIKLFEENSFNANIEDAKLVLIDPYGSPVPFFKHIIGNLSKGTIVALKATDIGTLQGRYPKRALEMYGKKIYKNNIPKEVAQRALILYALEELEKIGLSAKVLFSYSSSYYVYTFIKITEKTKLEKGFLNYDDRKKVTDIDERKIERRLTTEIYTGNLYDKEFLRKMESNLYKNINKGNKIYDFKKLIKLIEKTHHSKLFKYVYNIPELKRKYQKNFEGVFEKNKTLKFDAESITSNLPIKDFLDSFEDL